MTPRLSRWTVSMVFVGTVLLAWSGRPAAAATWADTWRPLGSACGGIQWEFRLSSGSALRSIQVRATNVSRVKVCGGIEVIVQRSDGRTTKTVLTAGTPPSQAGYSGWLEPRATKMVKMWRASGSTVHPRTGARAQASSIKWRDAWSFSEVQFRDLMERLDAGTPYNARTQGTRCRRSGSVAVGWEYIEHAQSGRHGRTRMTQDIRLSRGSRKLAFRTDVHWRKSLTTVWADVPLDQLGVVRLETPRITQQVFGAFYCVELRANRGKPFHIQRGREQNSNPDALLYFRTRSDADAAVAAIHAAIKSRAKRRSGG